MKSITKLLFLISIIAVFLIGCTSNESTTQQAGADISHEVQLSGEGEQDDLNEPKEDLTLEEETGSMETVEPDIITETNSVDEKLEEGTEKVESPPVAPKEVITKNKKDQTETTETEQQSTHQPAVPETKASTETTSSSQTAIESVEDPPTEQVKPKEEKLNEVTISIKGDAETGIILNPTNVEIETGDTVLDVLKNSTKAKRIHMEYQGRGVTAYIEGIDNLYEFDKGPKSGWMYNVNGTFKRNGAGVAEVKPGDRIEWVYTLDLGKDLGASY